MAKKERKVIGPVEFTDMAYGGEAVGRHEGMVVFAFNGAVGDVANGGRHHHQAHPSLAAASWISSSRRTCAPPRPAPTSAAAAAASGSTSATSSNWIPSATSSPRRSSASAICQVEVQPTIGMDEPWHYRNTMEFGFTREGEPGPPAHPGPQDRADPGVPHLSSRRSTRCCTRCLPLFGGESRPEVLPHNAFIRVGDAHSQVPVVGLFGHGDWPDIAETLVGEHPHLISGVVQRKGRGSEKGRTLFGNDFTEHVLLGKRYRAGIASFFQVNRVQVEALIGARARLAAAPAGRRHPGCLFGRWHLLAATRRKSPLNCGNRV